MSLSSLLAFCSALFCLGLALVVFLRGRHTFAHRILAIGMTLLGMEAIFTGVSLYVSAPAERIAWQRLRFMATAFFPGVWLLFSLSFGRANYRDFIAKWRWVVVSFFVTPVAMVTIFGSGFFEDEMLVRGLSHTMIQIGWAGYLFFLLLLMGLVLILMNLERTLHGCSGNIRWQIKFMILGLGSLLGIRIYLVSQVLLFRSLSLDLEILNSATLIIAGVLICVSLLRTSFFNVDFYLSPSFLYKSFTVLFVGIYLIAVGIVAKFAPYFKGNEDIPLEAFLVFLTLLGLVVLLLSGLLRRRMKWFISRNFGRPLYDYRREWAKFTQATASVTEIKELCFGVTKMISRTLDVPSVTIWLVHEEVRSVTLGGSVDLSEEKLRGCHFIEKGVVQLIRCMWEKKRPVDFDFSMSDWDWKNKGMNEDFFNETQIHYCLPLAVGGKLLGVMTLGDRVAKEPFLVEDFDLLKTIADQTAGSLLNLELAADLRQAREMEAFQTMSAFFVHDLKNLASKLSLTMQNLPIYFDNAEFRNDVVRTISQSLAKINGMCSRLSSLGQKLELQRTEADLNELVKNTLSGLNGCFRTSLIVDLHPLAEIYIDQEQIQRVLVNLILNANEAIKEGGEIRVTTEHQDGFIVLSVSDNGCGMSKEFVQNSLFRPFQTTKKQGMGIGLYHSKMIVEAHGGRIEVKSEEGKGSTFKVLLPLNRV